MTFKLYCPSVKNFGDFLNCLPVVSGLHKAINEKIKFVVPNEMEKIKGFRNFMEYQGIFEGVYFRKEIIGMEETTYKLIHYSNEEFRHITERPNRPIETMRHEKFIRDRYPELDNLNWEVDDNFEIQVYVDYGIYCDSKKTIIGDRWDKVADTRRPWNILKDSGLFNDETKYMFLDYNEDVMINAQRIKSSIHPFITPFTGGGIMADLMKKRVCLLEDNSMNNWDNAPITYSYWKHYYGDRYSKLCHLNDFKEFV